VYVIPPNVNMAITHRRLHLSPRIAEPGLHAPIDFFMRSLAEEHDSDAIGIVLSGTASDGTRGLAAIKAEGGITFAQDENSAKHAGMPHSAIVAGCVDFILPPDKIAHELARVSGHPYLNGHRSPVRRANIVATPKRVEEKFDRIFTILKNAGGIDFSLYKAGTLQRRTLRRMAIQRIDHVSDYAKFLEKHPKETEQLCQDLLIPVTSFFRDLKAFESLKFKVFPAILKDKSNTKSIRIWAPGCSTGEETYSLAMVLLEFLGDRAASFRIQLFGTDVNDRGIEKARAGFYQERISQEISPDRLRRFFTRADGGYRVSKDVRDLCVFAKQNVAEDPPFSNLNLVVCRNLLIYLAPDLQKQIVPILHYALRPSGFLFLGSAEGISGFQELFAPVDKKHKIFVKKAIASRLHYDFSSHRYHRETSIAGPAANLQEPNPNWTNQDEADQIVLKSYAPPGLVITEGMEIVQFRGAIGQYIEPASGRATLHVLKIVKKEFVSELRAAVNQAKKSHMPVKRKSVEFRRNRQPRSVSISVEPLGKSTEVPERYLILFERSFPAVPTPKTFAGKSHGRGRAAEENVRLRRKLASADEHIRALIESKEASDEEYQSTNEEILSANEELQSTSEELETSKEELQSTNEELNTVNDELRNRNANLDRLNDDLKNILVSTTLPIVLVDRNMNIRRLTPAAAKTLKILPSDVGRPITDIRSDINISNLDQLVSNVIETLTTKEMEVQAAEGHWYLLQIRPYRTSADQIDGAVVVLSDIDAAKKASELVRISKDFFRHSLDTVREPLLVFAKDLKVVYANPSFLRSFQVSRQETIGQFLYDLGNGQWKIPQLQKQLTEILSKDTPMMDFEVAHDFPKMGKRMMLLNGRRIKTGHLDEPIILLAIEDITERKQAEQILQQARDRLASLVENRTASLRKLSADMIHLQDEERRRISRDLHDSVGQYLAHAKLKVEALKKTDEKEAQAIAHIAETLDKCLTETRTISHLLHPPFLEEVGFRSSAKWYVEGFAERTGIRVNVDMPSEKQRLLHGPIELVLFRILQESLTNIHRHSKSSSVDVHLRLDPGKVTFEVRDYGKGIPEALLERFKESGQGAGIGLSSMRERVDELGGEFEIQSDGGTLIRVVLPWPTASAGKAAAEGSLSG
jgi:two-component system, chemotaxis family, CheB/CheR fusion protein